MLGNTHFKSLVELVKDLCPIFKAKSYLQSWLHPIMCFIPLCAAQSVFCVQREKGEGGDAEKEEGGR